MYFTPFFDLWIFLRQKMFPLQARTKTEVNFRQRFFLVPLVFLLFCPMLHIRLSKIESLCNDCTHKIIHKYATKEINILYSEICCNRMSKSINIWIKFKSNFKTWGAKPTLSWLKIMYSYADKLMSRKIQLIHIMMLHCIIIRDRENI